MATSTINNFLTEIPITIIGSNADCDDFRTTGFYRCSSANATAGSHMPNTAAFTMLVFNRGGSEANQLAFRGDGVWVRATGSGGFSAWKKLTPT